jgi:hypothetical protein
MCLRVHVVCLCARSVQSMFVFACVVVVGEGGGRLARTHQHPGKLGPFDCADKSVNAKVKVMVSGRGHVNTQLVENVNHVLTCVRAHTHTHTHTHTTHTQSKCQHCFKKSTHGR